MTTLPGDLTSPVAGPLLRRGALVIAEGESGVVVGISPLRVAWAHYAPCEVAASDVVLDLSDPAGMDLAARWIAAHHGLTVGATAPGWEQHEKPTRWELTGRDEAIQFQDDGYHHTVPGISALTDPALALRAACLAAVGRTG